MGTKVAPTYAWPFIGWLENRTLQTRKDQKFGLKLYSWHHCINDIFNQPSIARHVLVIVSEREEKEMEEKKKEDENLEIAFRLLKGMPQSVGSPGGSSGVACTAGVACGGSLQGKPRRYPMGVACGGSPREQPAGIAHKGSLQEQSTGDSTGESTGESIGESTGESTGESRRQPRGYLGGSSESSPEVDADHLSLPAHFSNLCLKISKLSLSALWKGFEIEINQRRTHYN